MAGALAQPVDGAQYRATGNDPALEAIFAGKVDKHDADNDCQGALTGQYQHGNAQGDKNVADDILGNQQSPSYNRMLVGPGFPAVTLCFGKIILGYPDYQNRNKCYGTDKTDNRGGGQPPYRVLIKGYPLKHAIVYFRVRGNVFSAYNTISS